MQLGRHAVADQARGVVDILVDEQVQGADAAWRNGIIVTHVSIRVTACRRGTCPPAVDFDLVGGRVGPVEQRLSDHSIPAVGDRVEVALIHARSGQLKPTSPMRRTGTAVPPVR